MKRVSFNSHQSPSYDEEARIRQDKHQSLLQDYLELQKEFVSKKKKLQSAKLKRETLWAEVRFLRLRKAYLLKTRTSKAEAKIDKLRNSESQPEISEISAMERNKYSANEAVLNSHTRVSDTKRILERAEGDEAIRGAIRIQKNPKNCFVNGKRAAKKKKISVQDRVVLEA